MQASAIKSVKITQQTGTPKLANEAEMCVCVMLRRR
jgi:hypothetical protein